MTTPQDLWFSKEHEWVRIEGEEAVFGISDHAQHQLGDITYVELPKIGRVANQFDQFSTVESVKAASDIYAPLSGEIIRVNDALDGAPEKINESPYGDGWICRVRFSNRDETNALMTAAQYEQYLKEIES